MPPMVRKQTAENWRGESPMLGRISNISQSLGYVQLKQADKEKYLNRRVH